MTSFYDDAIANLREISNGPTHPDRVSAYSALVLAQATLALVDEVRALRATLDTTPVGPGPQDALPKTIEITDDELCIDGYSFPWAVRGDVKIEPIPLSDDRPSDVSAVLIMQIPFVRSITTVTDARTQQA